MTTLRFRVDVLTKKAEAKGDHTHYAIAQRIGVRESTISRLMAGRTIPNLLTLAALAGAYGTSLDDLVERGTGTTPVQLALTVPAQRSSAAP